jgi:hypothetical protein
MSKVELASTFHDPDGRLLPMVDSAGGTLIRLYGGNAAVLATPTSNTKSVARLSELGFTTVVQDEKKDTIANNYKNSLQLGFDSSASHIHMIDFDRALHWAHTYPEELEEMIRITPNYPGLLTFARTPRAFETHPNIQKDVEVIINEAASKAAGKKVDIMSGAFSMDAGLADMILKQSKRVDAGLYAEYLMIAIKNGVKITNIQVEGLEWETPDKFQDEFKRDGYDAWLAQFESPAEKERRQNLLKECLEVLK